MAAKGTDIFWVTLQSKTPPHEWFVDPDLRPRMVADADAKGTNLTDLALQILCDHFKVEYAPIARKSSPNEDKRVLNFGVPRELSRAVNYAAAATDMKRMDVVRQVLSDHYGLSIPAKVKQTRNRTPKATPKKPAAKKPAAKKKPASAAA